MKNAFRTVLVCAVFAAALTVTASADVIYAPNYAAAIGIPAAIVAVAVIVIAVIIRAVKKRRASGGGKK